MNGNIPNGLASMLSHYRRQPGGGTHINGADIITDLGDAQQRMNARLDEVIPKRYRNATVDHPEVRAWVEQYVADPDDSPSLLIMGPVGTGKTYAAYGALRESAVRTLRPNRAGRYILGQWTAATFPDFVGNMRPKQSYNRDDVSSEAYLASLRATPLLVLDDLGVGKESEWVEEVTHRLVSGRYDDERATIYTTNLSPKELSDVIGARLVSRLVEQCTRVSLLGADRRRAR